MTKAHMTELIRELSVSGMVVFIKKQHEEFLLSLYMLEIMVVMGWFKRTGQVSAIKCSKVCASYY